MGTPAYTATYRVNVRINGRRQPPQGLPLRQSAPRRAQTVNTATQECKNIRRECASEDGARTKDGEHDDAFESADGDPAAAHDAVHDGGGTVVFDGGRHVIGVGAHLLGSAAHGDAEGRPLDHRDVVGAVTDGHGPT